MNTRKKIPVLRSRKSFAVGAFGWLVVALLGFHNYVAQPGWSWSEIPITLIAAVFFAMNMYYAVDYKTAQATHARLEAAKKEKAANKAREGVRRD